MYTEVNFFQFIICFTEMFLMDMFFSDILDKKENIFEFERIIVKIIFAIIISLVNQYTNLNVPVAIGIILFYAIFFYSNRLFSKIFYATIYFLAIAISDTLVVNISSIVLNVKIDNFMGDYSSTWIITSCISKVMLFIILKALARFGKETDTDIDKIYRYSVIIIFFILLSIMLTLLRVNKVTSDAKVSSLITIATVGVMIACMIIYAIFQNVFAYYKKVKAQEVKNLRSKFLEEYAEYKIKSDKEIRKMWHDLNNHIMTISALAYREDLDGIKEYIGEIKEEVERIPATISTGNDIVDAILNQKKIDSNKNNIRFNVKAIIPVKIKITNVDLCSFLGNAIDNAIEASLKVQDIDKRQINVVIDGFKDYLHIEIDNYIEDGEDLQRGELYTTKKDKKNHGLGLKSMESIVKKYSGSIKYVIDKNKFTVKAFLLFRD